MNSLGVWFVIPFSREDAHIEDHPESGESIHTDGGGARGRMGGFRWVWVLVAATAGLAVGFLIAETAPDPGPAPPPTVLASPATTSTVVAETVPLVTVAPPVVRGPGSVEPLDGMDALRGDVVFGLPTGTPGFGHLWVVREGGSIIRRDRVPLALGDFPHPILLTERRIVFADLGHAYLIDVDLAEPAIAVSEASFVVPGANPGSVWLVGPGSEWVAQLDLTSGELGAQVDVSEVAWWAHAGVGDGLIVSPLDESEYGRYAYWSPSEGLSRLGLPDRSRPYIAAAAGSLVAVVSPGLEVDILDLSTGEYIGFAVDLPVGEGEAVAACLSPDQDLLAAGSLTGGIVVVHTRTGSVVGRLPAAVGAVGTTGWTASDQLVYNTDVDDSLGIQAFDITTGTANNIASVPGASGGWLAASGTMC